MGDSKSAKAVPRWQDERMTRIGRRRRIRRPETLRMWSLGDQSDRWETTPTLPINSATHAHSSGIIQARGSPIEIGPTGQVDTIRLAVVPLGIEQIQQRLASRLVGGREGV